MKWRLPIDFNQHRRGEPTAKANGLLPLQVSSLTGLWLQAIAPQPTTSRPLSLSATHVSAAEGGCTPLPKNHNSTSSPLHLPRQVAYT